MPQGLLCRTPEVYRDLKDAGVSDKDILFQADSREEYLNLVRSSITAELVWCPDLMTLWVDVGKAWAIHSER